MIGLSRLAMTIRPMADHLLVALRLADDGKGVLPDLVGGRDV